MNCFIDIGCVATRTIIARGHQIYFARTIPVGGDHFSRATANALKIKLDEAKLLRVKIAQAGATAAPADEPAPAAAVARSDASVDNSFALLGAAMAGSTAVQSQSATAVAEPAAAAPAATGI